MILAVIIAFLLLLMMGLMKFETIGGGRETLMKAPPIRTVAEISGSLPYKEESYSLPTCHIGQRKLFASELQFLTSNLEKNTDSAVVVYAGSSPCNHVYLLRQMFPNVKFILVDPNETYIYVNTFLPKKGLLEKPRIPHYKKDTGDILYFKVSGDKRYETKERTITAFVNGAKVRLNRDENLEKINSSFDPGRSIDRILQGDERIFIVEDFFTNELAEMCRGLGRVYFWSDVRTDSGGVPTDANVLLNSAQQLSWVNIMRPEKYMLKFRCPFAMQPVKEVKAILGGKPEMETAAKFGIDFLQDYGSGKFRYLRGECYLQCYPKVRSAETRLVGDSLEVIEYDTKNYEDKLFYYNTVRRPFLYTFNPYASKKRGYDHCADCGLEASILAEAASKTGYEVNHVLDALEVITRRSLLMGKHGRFFG